MGITRVTESGYICLCSTYPDLALGQGDEAVELVAVGVGGGERGAVEQAAVEEPEREGLVLSAAGLVMFVLCAAAG